jgi:hypothetical protein
MVQGDIEFASIVMLNLVQHLVITDYGMNSILDLMGINLLSFFI